MPMPRLNRKYAAMTDQSSNESFMIYITHSSKGVFKLAMAHFECQRSQSMNVILSRLKARSGIDKYTLQRYHQSEVITYLKHRRQAEVEMKPLAAILGLVVILTILWDA